jgi:anti-sigma regulatory factor (Ser/Thr protein kinase)
MNGVAVRVPIVESSQVAEARRIATGVAARVGFDESEAGVVGLAVTEIATNLVKHATAGELLVLDLIQDKQAAIQVLAFDKGPGMRSVAECMRDGYSTAGSPGTGLGAISRLADFFDIYSTEKGTTLIARFRNKKEPRSVAHLEVDGLSVAVQSEEVSGDGWAFRATPGGVTVLVVDGLGHGTHAEDAARIAIAAFQETSAVSILDVLDVVHRSVRCTRGAAAALTMIDLPSQTARFAGIGNISGVIVSGGYARHMVSMNGILGHEMRTAREFSYPWSPNAVLILHSDGVSSRWDLSGYPGLIQKSAGLIAGVLYKDHKRERDDATVVVVKPNRQNGGGQGSTAN